MVADTARGVVIRAAGGVVQRRDEYGRWTCAIIHRPRYDDWTIPKGKLDPGETPEDAAVREVEEETGLRTRLLDELSPVSYHDRHGRPKQVRYWLMEAANGAPFAANSEVDELRWCSADEADKLLTYEHDRGLVAELRNLNLTEDAS